MLTIRQRRGKTPVAAESRHLRSGQTGGHPGADSIEDSSARKAAMNDPQYVDVDGARTRYFSAGEGEPLVLVHGGHFGQRASAEDWDVNFDRLARDHRVVAMDKLGMGFTDNPKYDYTIESQAAHLHSFLDALGLDGAHLVGHSRGGYAVTRVALDHPERVHSLTVVSSSSVTTPFNPIYGEWRRQAETMEDGDGVRFLIAANSYSDSHITERMVDVGVEIGRMAKTIEAARLMAEGLYDAFKVDLLERVDKIKDDVAGGGLTMPTLLIWGFNDPSATLDRCLKPALDLFFPAVRDCEMSILNRAGHYCFREQPEAFADTLINFIHRSRQSRR
jgi:2-hydroxy-6-oxo-6-(2'-carboxyphenyl)-hexa-2,4-dienoate hydrolase